MSSYFKFVDFRKMLRVDVSEAEKVYMFAQFYTMRIFVYIETYIWNFQLGNLTYENIFINLNKYFLKLYLTM